MISLKTLVCHCSIALVLSYLVVEQSVGSVEIDTLLSRILKRRNAQGTDYDEFNTIGVNPATRARALIPRLDNRNTQESIWPRPNPRCSRKISVLNGVTKFREKGSLVRFECSYGFSLFGAKLAVCIRGQWSEPPPICTRLGCRRLQQLSNGIARLTNGGAIVAFFCNEGYRMLGRSVVFCDGNRWNGTEPTCTHDTPTTSSTPRVEIIPTTGESTLSPSQSMLNSSSTANPELWDYVITSTISPLAGISTKSSYSSRYATNTSTTPNSISSSVTEFIESKPDIRTNNSLIEYPKTQPPTITFIPSSTTREPQKAESQQEVLSTIKTPIPVPVIEITPTRTTVPISKSTFRTTIKTEEIVTPTIYKLNSSRSPSKSTTTFTLVTRSRSTPNPSRNPQLPVEPNKTTLKSQTTPKTKHASETSTTTTPRLFLQATTKSMEPDFPFPDNTFKKFDEELSNDYGFPEYNEPISPHKLDNNDSHENHHKLVAQISLVAGILLIITGSLFLTGGIVMYCWRKNKGIARARSYDADGRTLSASDANDDFMWMEPSDSRL